MRNLNTTITHWVVISDGFGGYTFTTPVELLGRWERRNEVFRDAKGDETISKSIVYLNTDVAVYDYLFEGASEGSDPTFIDGAVQVLQFAKTPDLRNLDSERKAYI